MEKLRHVATSFDGRITKNINDVVDKIFSSIRINATKGGWDPITLRPESDTFSVTVEYCCHKSDLEFNH